MESSNPSAFICRLSKNQSHEVAQTLVFTFNDYGKIPLSDTTSIVSETARTKAAFLVSRL